MELIIRILVKIVAYSIVFCWAVKKIAAESRIMLADAKNFLSCNWEEPLSYCNEEFLKNLEDAYKNSYFRERVLKTRWVKD